MIKTPSKMEDEDNKKLARFQNALADNIAEWRQMNNGKQPTQEDTQAIINRLLLPIVNQDAEGNWYGGTAETSGCFLRLARWPKARRRKSTFPYEDIPRNSGRGSNGKCHYFGRVPSRAEVEAKYTNTF